MRYITAQGVTDARTLADAVAEAIARIDADFAQRITAGMTWSGKPLQIDPASTANMTSVSALTSKGSALPADFAWRMGDNTFLPMTAAQQASMAAAAAAYVMALRKAMWAAKDAARAARTREEADAVQVAWPK
jgi:hypothetical protein